MTLQTANLLLAQTPQIADTAIVSCQSCMSAMQAAQADSTQLLTEALKPTAVAHLWPQMHWAACLVSQQQSAAALIPCLVFF